MAGYDLSDRFGYTRHTSTTLTATGATTLVGAPAAGAAIAIDHIKILLTTDTSSRLDVYLSPSLTAASIGRIYTNQTLSSSNDGIALNQTYNPPIVIDTATALLVMCTASAASTPGASVEVTYRILTRP